MICFVLMTAITASKQSWLTELHANGLRPVVHVAVAPPKPKSGGPSLLIALKPRPKLGSCMILRRRCSDAKPSCSTVVSASPCDVKNSHVQSLPAKSPSKPNVMLYVETSVDEVRGNGRSVRSSKGASGSGRESRIVSSSVGMTSRLIVGSISTLQPLVIGTGSCRVSV